MIYFMRRTSIELVYSQLSQDILSNNSFVLQTKYIDIESI